MIIKIPTFDNRVRSIRIDEKTIDAMADHLIGKKLSVYRENIYDADGDGKVTLKDFIHRIRDVAGTIQPIQRPRLSDPPAPFSNTYSLEFDGSDDHVSVPAELDAGGGDWTVSGWFYLPADISGDGLWGYDNNNTLYRNSTTTVRIYWNGGIATSTITPDDWNHIVVTRSGDTFSVYVDAGSPATGTDSATDAGTTFILGGQGSSTQPFEGKMDEVGIWDKALDADAITAIYNSGTPIALDADSGDYDNSGDLQGWWRMGDGDLDDGNIAGNGLIADQNSPTLGSELWDSDASTDPYNEGSWTTYGSNALSDDGGALKSTYVDNAGVAKIIFKDAADLSADLVAGTVYKLQFDIKVNTGTVAVEIQASTPAGNVEDITNTSFETKTYYFIANSTTSDYLKIAEFSPEQTVHIDNLSLKAVSGNSGMMINMTASDIVTDTP